MAGRVAVWENSSDVYVGISTLRKREYIAPKCFYSDYFLVKIMFCKAPVKMSKTLLAKDHDLTKSSERIQRREMELTVLSPPMSA